MSRQSAAHQGGLAELVDALDSKSSSNECGFESHSRYFSLIATAGISPTHAEMASPDTTSRTIGIIAGSGVYPETFIAEARRKAPGIRLVVVAFHGETKPELEKLADATEWVRVGQLSKLIKFFRREGADEAVMMGQISPKNLFDLRPDLRILMMLARVKERNAETLFGAIGDELAKDGITLLPATTFLEDHLPGPGYVCGPAFKKRQLADADFGFRIAKQTSALDIGQSVVVRHGTVLAAEAFEGTSLHQARRRAWPRERRAASQGFQAEPGFPFRRAGHRPADHRDLRRRRGGGHRHRGGEDLAVGKSARRGALRRAWNRDSRRGVSHGSKSV